MTLQVDLDRINADWDRDGYIFIKGFVSPDEAKDISNNIQRYISEIIPTLPDTAAIYEDKTRPDTIFRLQNMEKHDNYFKNLYNDSRFVNLAKTLLDDEVVTISMQWFNKPPDSSGETPPHQDGFYWMLEPNKALTMWLALDFVDEENGCIRYIPGAHKRGIRPHQRSNVLGFSQGISDYGAQDYSEEICIRAEPGDMAVHHSMIVHRADPNSSKTRTRQALGFVYFPVTARRDEEKAAAYREKLFEQWAKEGKI